MTTTSSLTTAEPADASPRQRKLILSLGLIAFASYLALSGIPGVVLQVQIQDIDPANKESALGLVTSLGALVGVFLNPLWGAISDRTRSRWGRRAPVIALGTIIVCVGITILSTASSIAMLAVGIVVLEAGFSASQSPIVAMLPDRISVRIRGIASSVLGFGIMLGTVVGQILGARLVQINIPVTYATGAALMVLIVVIFLLLNPDRSSRDLKVPPFRLGDFVRSYWVDPRRHPDFGWAFWSRAATVVGYAAITTFTLYILQDYIGMSRDEALRIVPTLAITGVVGMTLSILLSGWLSDRSGRRKPFVFAASLLSGLACLIPLTMPTTTGMIVFSFVSGLGYGCFLAVDNALITLVLPSSANSAKDLGVAFIASGGAQAVGPVLASTVVVHLGGYPQLFVISLVISIIGGLLVLPIRSVK